MARRLSLSLSKMPLSPTPRPSSSSHLLCLRAQSTYHRSKHAELIEIDTASASSDPLMQKLEDAIHRIIVRRSAPDWLPFVPGASYWVPPPRSQTHGIAQLVEKLANPMTSEESLSTTSSRGWPSSDYFIKGSQPRQMEVETASNSVYRSDEEEE